MEKLLGKWLRDNDINYLFLTYTECYSGLISVTFDIDLDMDLYLNLIKYKSKFNKSQYIIIPETKTIMVYGGSANEIIKSVRRIYGTWIS